MNGVLGTPDVLEDLLLLGALDDKVAIGSMNRGGLAGAVFGLDDRFTSYDRTQLLVEVTDQVCRRSSRDVEVHVRCLPGNYETRPTIFRLVENAVTPAAEVRS